MNTPSISDNSYRVISRIGAGGSGTVYKAWHTRLQKHVVIKELKHSMSDNAQTYRNEVEALKNIKNPYLPQVYDFIVQSCCTFTVMEYIGGESFDILLERGENFSQFEVIKWYGQLASALESLHSQNICHRDIKPANIMLTPGRDICLIDFNTAFIKGGAARFISRSFGYASPEQYKVFERFERGHCAVVETLTPDCISIVCADNGDKTELSDNKTELSDGGGQSFDEFITHHSVHVPCPAITNPWSQTPDPSSISRPIDWKRSDIYSLGATMYHILTGERPQKRAEDVAALSELGRFDIDLAYIIERSMQPSPSERFTSAAALADAIRCLQRQDQMTEMNTAAGKTLLFSALAGICGAASATFIIQSALFGNRHNRRYR